MKYREMIYHICSETDFSDKAQATRLAQQLAAECADLHDLMMEYDAKLKELMTAKDYSEWSVEVARRQFGEEVKRMPDSEFKDFVTEHLKEITDGY